MAMGRRAKNRLKMFGLIFCCSSVIAALATSTMAWYAAESSITVDPSSSSVTIRTPFQYHLYAYKGNRFPSGSGWSAAINVSNPGSGYSTANWTMTDTKSYEEYNALAYYSDNHNYYKNTLLSVAGLWPGYKMSFYIKAEGLTSEDQPVLKITSVVPGAAKNLGEKEDINRKAYGTGNVINLADAIKVSGGKGASLDLAISDCAQRNTLMTSWWTSPLRLDDGTATPAGGNSGVYYYFYTVEFSDDPSTWYYHCKSSSDSNPKAGPETSGDNYYKRDSTQGVGNSSAYEGLVFQLATMTLENPS